MGSFLMLITVLMKWEGILQMQLFQINQSEESSKISINAHTTAASYIHLHTRQGRIVRCVQSAAGWAGCWWSGLLPAETDGENH